MRAVDLDLAGAAPSLPRDRAWVLVREGPRVLGDAVFDWRRAPSFESMLDDVVSVFGAQVHARTVVHREEGTRARPLDVALVVVGSGSGSAETTLRAAERLDPSPVDVVAVERGDAVAGARTLARRLGEHAAVALVQAGVEPVPGYAGGVGRALSITGAEAAIGPVVAGALERPWQRWRAAQVAAWDAGFDRRLLHRRALLPRAAHLLAPSRAHVAVRAMALAAVHTPDDLAQVVPRILSAGGVVVHEPDMTVRAPVEPTMRSAVRAAFVDGATAAALTDRYGDVVAGTARRWQARQALSAARAVKRGAVGEAVLHAAAAAGASRWGRG